MTDVEVKFLFGVAFLSVRLFRRALGGQGGVYGDGKRDCQCMVIANCMKEMKLCYT